MKKTILPILVGILTTPLLVFAASVFTSGQIGTSPTNGYVLQTNGATSTWVSTSTLGISSGGILGGANTNIQYNNNGSFGGDSGFVWDKDNKMLTISTTSTDAPNLITLHNNATVGAGSGIAFSFNFAGLFNLILNQIKSILNEGGTADLVFYGPQVGGEHEYMRLAGSGSLLIGTSTDSGLGLLQVIGTSTTEVLKINNLSNTLLGVDTDGYVIATSSDFVSYSYASSTFLTISSSTSLPYVTAVTVTAANGVSALVANQGTTPTLTFTLGDIIPTKVNGQYFGGSSVNQSTNIVAGATLPSNVGMQNTTAIGINAMALSTQNSYSTALGWASLRGNLTGNNMIGIGAFSGYYSTSTGNEFFVNSIDRGSYTGDKNESLLYGVMNTASTSQSLKINGTVIIPTGTQFVPSLYFSGFPTTGISHSAADVMNLIVGGQNSFSMTPFGAYAGVPGSSSTVALGVNSSNNGFFSPTTNMVAISTNSRERMRIDNNGNILIGTTTAISNLTIVNSSSTASSTLSIGSSYSSSTAPSILCMWNGSNFTKMTFASNSITPIYSTSTVCQ